MNLIITSAPLELNQVPEKPRKKEREKKVTMAKVGLGVAVMSIVEVLMVGSNSLNKAAMTKGMSKYIFIAYTHAIGLFLLLPFAFLVHRKSPFPHIGFSTIMQIFLLAVINYCASFTMYTGISYSSPTLASAMLNLTPALTFIIAIILRMEMLNVRAKCTILKLIGTLVSVAGAFTVTFYRGWSIIVFPSPTNSSSFHTTILQNQQNWAIGAFFLATCAILVSLLCIVKTWITRDFPWEVLITVIAYIFETIMALIVALMVEEDSQAWIPRSNFDLINILFGVVALGGTNVASIWACRCYGPLFTAMFSPLGIVLAIVIGVCFLKDVLYFGSVIGGIIIALGFYTVIKGKAEEEKLKQANTNSLICNSETSLDHKVPLLLNKSMV